MADAPERQVRCQVTAAEAGQRLDRFLARRFDYHSRAEWARLLAAGAIRRNGQPAKAAARLQAGDELQYLLPGHVEPAVDPACPELYRDGALLVLNKSGNLPMHPAGPYFRHTLWHQLRDRLGAGFHLVNRLDRETSGAVLVALDEAAGSQLAVQFQEHRVEKEYLAVVEGTVAAPFSVEGWLAPDPESAVRVKRRLWPRDPGGGESASTHFEPLASRAGLSLLRCRPRSGRRHQLRASLLAAGFPLVGDKLYGLDETLYLHFIAGTLTAADQARLRLPRQALHAAALSFIHPASGQPLRVEAPPPSDLAAFLAQAGLGT